jgi:hypothetical protein
MESMIDTESTTGPLNPLDGMYRAESTFDDQTFYIEGR